MKTEKGRARERNLGQIFSIQIIVDLLLNFLYKLDPVLKTV